MSKVLLVLCALISVALAALGRYHLEPIPEKYGDQEGCYVKNLDRVLPFGTSVPTDRRGGNTCVEYRCRQTEVVVASCGVLAVPEGCETVTDDDKPYPDCCPKPGPNC